MAKNGGPVVPLKLPKMVFPAAFERLNPKAGVVEGLVTVVVKRGGRLPALKLVTPVPPPLPPTFKSVRVTGRRNTFGGSPPLMVTSYPWPVAAKNSHLPGAAALRVSALNGLARTD